MTTIGFIGSGNIGGNLARAAAAKGYDVVVSNSRGPDALASLVDELGPSARAATPAEAAEAADIAVVSVPFHAIGSLPAQQLAGKLVIDPNNYYPHRDGAIAELDAESTTTSELLQAHLPGATVVKAFNHIAAAHILEHAKPAGAERRRALGIAGDEGDAKARAIALVDELGFDVVDVGPLAEGWRVQRDTPVCERPFTADEMRPKIAEARRYRDM